MGFGNFDLAYVHNITSVAEFNITPVNVKTRYWGIIVAATTATSGEVRDGATNIIHEFIVPAGETLPIMLPSAVSVHQNLQVEITAGTGSFTVVHGYE